MKHQQQAGITPILSKCSIPLVAAFLVLIPHLLASESLAHHPIHLVASQFSSDPSTQEKQAICFSQHQANFILPENFALTSSQIEIASFRDDRGHLLYPGTGELSVMLTIRNNATLKSGTPLAVGIGPRRAGIINIGSPPECVPTIPGQISGRVWLGTIRGRGTLNFNHSNDSPIFDEVILSTGFGKINRFNGTTVLKGRHFCNGTTTIYGGEKCGS